MIGPKTQFLSFMAMATKNRYNNTLVSKAALHGIQNRTEICQRECTTCQHTGDIRACRRAKKFCFVDSMHALSKSGVNVYDIRHRCKQSNSSISTPTYCYGSLFPHIARLLDDFKTRNKLLLPLTVRLKAFSSSLMAQLQIQGGKGTLRGALQKVLPHWRGASAQTGEFDTFKIEWMRGAQQDVAVLLESGIKVGTA
jgi:hypothetical protein